MTHRIWEAWYDHVQFQLDVLHSLATTMLHYVMICIEDTKIIIVWYLPPILLGIYLGELATIYNKRFNYIQHLIEIPTKLFWASNPSSSCLGSRINTSSFNKLVLTSYYNSAENMITNKMNLSRKIHLLISIKELSSCTKRSKFFLEDPPGRNVLCVIWLTSLAFFLRTSPVVSSIKSRTTLSISSCRTISFNFLSTAMAILRISTQSWLFSIWSPSRGQVIIGTPVTMLSEIEFHPQCVRNPPIAGCPKMRACGAHDK